MVISLFKSGLVDCPHDSHSSITFILISYSYRFTFLKELTLVDN